MGLFGRPGNKLLQEYRGNLRIFVWKNRLPMCSPAVEHVGPEEYRFNVVARRETSQSLGIHADSQTNTLSAACVSHELDPAISPSFPRNADLQLPPVEYSERDLISKEDAHVSWKPEISEFAAASAKVVGLISAEDLQYFAVDPRRFDAIVKRFSFPSVQKEPSATLFGQRLEPRTRTGRVSAVAPPDPPPELKQADLQERLRWLLTPPIHEILSDPQLALPETPFPYQTRGIKWLYDRKVALLADEMGLGKTMQAIIAARLLFRDGIVKHILIVCPKSLILNWRRELCTWWPGSEWFTKVVETDRKWFLRLAKDESVIKIINYESLRKELDWLKEKSPHHDLIIIDEAQRIKTPTSDTAKATKALKADRRWALTGTPLENSLDDLVSIMEFVSPELVKKPSMAGSMRTIIKPHMLRRKQEEVLTDLPAMVEQEMPVELGDRQREAYDRAEREGVVELNEKGDTIAIMHVFALINKLRQLCNFDQASGQSAKAELLQEELEEIVQSGRKALIFGQFVEEPFGLKRLAKVLAQSDLFRKGRAILQLHGGIRPQQRDSIVEQFQKEPKHQLLLLNYTVGGVGLNLQAANYVFLFDRWWNPAVEDQAIKRCHRLGQKHAVFAKRLYCKETIEERILEKLRDKRRLFNHVIDEDRPAATMGLTDEEFFDLFKGLTVRPRHSNQTAAPSQVVLDNLNAKEFEDLVGLIYEKDGYTVQVTGRSHDGGIDILAERTTAGGKDRVIVQCKHQKQNVGRPVLQQLWGVLTSDSSLTRCDAVTSAGFTLEAREFAIGKRLTLIDRTLLEELARKHKIAQFVTL